MTETLAETDPWSATAADLYAALRENTESGTDTVIATIVDVEGSAYRRPGAKMMIAPDGDSLGAITAGCLEGPVTSLASDVLETGQPRIETFDLMDDDGDEWGLGLGCRGIIDIHLEPLEAGWELALSELDARRQVAMLTAIEGSGDVAVGDRALIDADGEVRTPGDRPALPESVLDAVRDHADALREGADSGAVTVETEDGPVTVFVDWLTPAPDLLLFGNQNDVHPVARIGREAGFRVVVASARGARAGADQFPNAHAVRGVRAPDLADAVDDPERTYAVLMSHNLIDDRLALESVLETAVPYVGLMGPRERFEELREGLDRPLSESELDRVATPVGLDLGGGEPIHIALSIVGEALAVHNDRPGGRLKDREGPIHERVDAV